MKLTLDENESGSLIDFTLSGKFPNTTLRERLARKFLGENYAYSMRYQNACLGLLTTMKNVKYVPPLHMIYAYLPVEPGKIKIQNIYVAARRSGIFGYVFTYFLLLCTKMLYLFLRGEDGKIYDNIRYNPNALLSIDRPLVEYMKYVERLTPSVWSKVRVKGD